MNNYDTSYYSGSSCRCRLESRYGRTLPRIQQSPAIVLQRRTRPDCDFPNLTLYANSIARIADMAIGYINTELDLLRRYDRKQEEPMQSEPLHRWTGTLVELVELIYGLQELRCIDDGETAINELIAFFGRIFGLDIKDRNCYNAYLDMKRRKNDSRTYFLDKMRERLNLRMQRDDEKEMKRRR